MSHCDAVRTNGQSDATAGVAIYSDHLVELLTRRIAASYQQSAISIQPGTANRQPVDSIEIAAIDHRGMSFSSYVPRTEGKCARAEARATVLLLTGIAGQPSAILV